MYFSCTNLLTSIQLLLLYERELINNASLPITFFHLAVLKLRIVVTKWKLIITGS